MPSLWRSAAYRLAFGYTGICVLVLLVLGVCGFYATNASLKLELDRALSGEMSTLQREYREGGMPDLADAIAKHRRRPGNRFLYGVYDPKGALIAGVGPAQAPVPGWNEIDLAANQGLVRDVRVHVVRLGRGERLLVGSDTSDLKRLREILLVLLGIAVMAMAALGVIGAAVFGRHLRRRLDAISTTARAIIAGDLTMRVPIENAEDEFGQAGMSLNLMLERIAKLVDNLRQVSSDVAHDLSTPLQRLRGAVDAGLGGPQEAPALRAALGQTRDQCDAMIALFEGILGICEVESGEAKARFKTVDLAALAAGVCEMYRPEIEDGGRTLTCLTAGNEMVVAGDRDLLAQALTNLLDNALIHTPPGTCVRVSARRSGAIAQLIVADNGPGVPAHERERILQRFVRLDRSRTIKGHGLGLNLVAAIVATHDGQLDVEDEEPGLRVVLNFPSSAAIMLQPSPPH